MLGMDEILSQADWAWPKAPPCVFVLFGATGDLAARKIAPALYNLYRDGLLGDNFAVLGVARRGRDDKQFRAEMLDAIRLHSRGQPIDEGLWNEFSSRWRYHATQFDDVSGYLAMRDVLADLDNRCGAGGNRLFYLAGTPETFGSVIGNIGAAGLNKPQADGAFTRIVVEKPFGHDLASAARLNKTLLNLFDESQVFRIDHYLGKETVQNLLAFRFANAVFEPVFNNQYVSSVQITASESAGMEGRRGPYYESAGALRDMFQSHLLQLLALTAMDAPSCIACQAIRDEKAKVLRAVSLGQAARIDECTVRGQYATGGGLAAYRQEAGVDPASNVETFVAARVFVDNRRWAGVPFFLRTGKRLAVKATYIVVNFKREPVNLWTDQRCDVRGPNRLVYRIVPDEGVSLVIDAKVPGAAMLLRPVNMRFDYSSSFSSASPEAYEHLLLDSLAGDATLFIRNDEVEAAWRFVDTIRGAWDVSDKGPLVHYPCGSWGPPQAQSLLHDPYMRWYEPTEGR